MPLNVTACKIIHGESIRSLYPQIPAKLQFMASFMLQLASCKSEFDTEALNNLQINNKEINSLKGERMKCNF
jgi:hypothetical protein